MASGGDLQSRAKAKKEHLRQRTNSGSPGKEKTSVTLGIQEGWCGWSRMSERKTQLNLKE